MLALMGILMAGLAISAAWSWRSKQLGISPADAILVAFTPEEDRLLAWAHDVVMRFMRLSEARSGTGVTAMAQSSLPGTVEEIKKALVIVALVQMRDPGLQRQGMEHVKRRYSVFLNVYTQLIDVVSDESAARARETMRALQGLRPDSTPEEVLAIGKIVAKNKDDFASDAYLGAPDLAAEFHERVTRHIANRSLISAV